MQTLAIFLDTWRMLKARKLFWIALVLTVLAGSMMAIVSFPGEGLKILHWTIDWPGIRVADGSAATFYLGVFYFLTDWWTSGIGVVLALITCSSVFPEMILQGGIDALLSKPISRGRLFLAKYFSGLLFAGSLAVVLAAIAWLCIRWKLGYWHTAIWWSVPLVLVLFSALYSVLVLVGVWFRSALASVILTLIFWGVCWALHLAERVSGELARSPGMALVANSKVKAEGGGGDSTGGNAELARRIFKVAMTFLPKTTEMTGLIGRSVETERTRTVRRQEELDAEVDGRLRILQLSGKAPPIDRVKFREEVEREFESKKALEKSPGYIIGTTLAFQAVILLWAGWIFSRRDY